MLVNDKVNTQHAEQSFEEGTENDSSKDTKETGKENKLLSSNGTPNFSKCPRFSCEVCGKGFNIQCFYKKHVNTEHKEEHNKDVPSLTLASLQPVKHPKIHTPTSVSTPKKKKSDRKTSSAKTLNKMEKREAEKPLKTLKPTDDVAKSIQSDGGGTVSSQAAELPESSTPSASVSTHKKRKSGPKTYSAKTLNKTEKREAEKPLKTRKPSNDVAKSIQSSDAENNSESPSSASLTQDGTPKKGTEDKQPGIKLKIRRKPADQENNKQDDEPKSTENAETSSTTTARTSKPKHDKRSLAKTSLKSSFSKKKKPSIATPMKDSASLESSQASGMEVEDFSHSASSKVTEKSSSEPESKLGKRASAKTSLEKSSSKKKKPSIATPMKDSASSESSQVSETVAKGVEEEVADKISNKSEPKSSTRVSTKNSSESSSRKKKNPSISTPMKDSASPKSSQISDMEENDDSVSASPKAIKTNDSSADVESEPKLKETDSSKILESSPDGEKTCYEPLYVVVDSQQEPSGSITKTVTATNTEPRVPPASSKYCSICRKTFANLFFFTSHKCKKGARKPKEHKTDPSPSAPPRAAKLPKRKNSTSSASTPKRKKAVTPASPSLQKKAVTTRVTAATDMQVDADIASNTSCVTPKNAAPTEEKVLPLPTSVRFTCEKCAQGFALMCVYKKHINSH